MKIFFLLTAFLILAGCQDVKHPEKPKNLISKSTMVDVLADAYLANAARSINLTAVRTKGLQLDSLIYKKYNIDSLQFAQSNAYYADNLNTYIELFQKVQLKLKKLQDEMTPEKDKALKTSKAKVNDSIL